MRNRAAPDDTRASAPWAKGAPHVHGRPNIVLVHGAWADGSCWSGVIERLEAAGLRVRAPQFPLSSLVDDVARLRQVLEFQDGPTILAGHSYGGQIITALGPDPTTAVGLVYIAAFGLDQGESLGSVLAPGPVTPALKHLFTDSHGYCWLSGDDFVSHFAADVDPTRARESRAFGGAWLLDQLWRRPGIDQVMTKLLAGFAA
jgi:pimeloyl-ACP methyl ester carboxylesterase